MTSVVGSGDQESAQAAADLWFLTVLGEQARLALSHLLQVWQWEGDPPDASIWRTGEVPEEVVWGDLQGALFAGILIDRILRAPKPKPGRGSSAALKWERANRLRSLLDIPEDSQLLKVAAVRNSMEHLDERMDRVIADRSIASVTDAAISQGGLWFKSVDAEEIADDETAMRHVAMRVFSPEVGLLIYDNDHIDLWAWEAALHGLLSQIRDAQDDVVSELRADRVRYGTAKPQIWDVAYYGADRRARIHAIREQFRQRGEFLLRPSQRPATVDLVVKTAGRQAGAIL